MMDDRQMKEKYADDMVCGEMLDLITVLEHNEEQDFEELLDYCRENEIQLKLYGREADAQWLLEIRNLIMTQFWDKMKKVQGKGIRQALQNKKIGKGSYGRPRIELPDDFGEQLQQRIKKHESLRVYCQELNMKSSTFYKYVREYKQRWNDSKQ